MHLYTMDMFLRASLVRITGGLMEKDKWLQLGGALKCFFILPNMITGD